MLFLSAPQAQEENSGLKKKEEQLQQKIEDWKKSYAELRKQIKPLEKSQRELEAVLTHKDDTVSALTNYITQLSELECRLNLRVKIKRKRIR